MRSLSAMPVSKKLRITYDKIKELKCKTDPK
jgi:hypothetical protein